MKECKECGKLKKLSDFPKEKRNKDGYGGRCKECVKNRKKITDAKRYRENIQIKKYCKECGIEYIGCKLSDSNLCISCRNKGKNNPMYGISKENHWNWNENITEEERINKRNYIEYDMFRKQVFERDDYTCQITGVRGGDLVVHHLYSYSKYPKLRLDLDNGIALSKDIHKLFHDTYGYHNATYDDFLEFIERYNNGDFE